MRKFLCFIGLHKYEYSHDGFNSGGMQYGNNRIAGVRGEIYNCKYCDEQNTKIRHY